MMQEIISFLFYFLVLSNPYRILFEMEIPVSLDGLLDEMEIPKVFTVIFSCAYYLITSQSVIITS